MDRKGICWGKISSTGTDQKNPPKIFSVINNCRILLKITKREHGAIFIECDRTDRKIMACEVKMRALYYFGYCLTLFEDTGNIVTLF